MGKVRYWTISRNVITCIIVFLWFRARTGKDLYRIFAICITEELGDLAANDGYILKWRVKCRIHNHRPLLLD